MNTPQKPQLHKHSVMQRALLWWSNPTLEAAVKKEQLCEKYYGSSVGKNYKCLSDWQIEHIFKNEATLFRCDCFNRNCVYNVSSICKCTGIGYECQSHVA